MIPRAIIGQPRSSAFVGSDAWHALNCRRLYYQSVARGVAAAVKSMSDSMEALSPALSPAFKSAMQETRKLASALDRVSEIARAKK